MDQPDSKTDTVIENDFDMILKGMKQQGQSSPAIDNYSPKFNNMDTKIDTKTRNISSLNQSTTFNGTEDDLDMLIQAMRQGQSNQNIENETESLNEENTLDNKSFNNSLSRSGWGGRVKYAVNKIENTKQRQQTEDIFRDPNKMLSVAMSTIMLWASGKYDIPAEYYIWTELYLKSITDKMGKVPPNIKNLLEHIAIVKEKYHKEKFGGLPVLVPKRSRIPIAKRSGLRSDSTSDSSFITTGPIASSTMIGSPKLLLNSSSLNYIKSTSPLTYIPWQMRPIYRHITNRLMFNYKTSLLPVKSFTKYALKPAIPSID